MVAKSNQVAIDVGDNAPPEPVSEVALAVIASLEKTPERWRTDDKEVWCVDGSMRIKVEGGLTSLKVELAGTGSHFGGDMPASKASQAAIWGAYKAWQAKRMITYAGRPDEVPEPEPAWWQKAIARGFEGFYSLLFLIPAAVAILAAIGLSVSALASLNDRARMTDAINAANVMRERIHQKGAAEWFRNMPPIDISQCGDDACYRRAAEMAARSEGYLIRSGQ